MTHFARELSDPQWALGLTTGLHTVIRNIDEKSLKFLNDSSGAGTWTPTAPIIIGGEGLKLYCQLQVNAASTGANIYPGIGKFIKFGDDDYFKLLTYHERQLFQSPLPGVSNGLNPREFTALGRFLYGLRAGARVRVPLTKLPHGQRLQSIDTTTNGGDYKIRIVRLLADGTIEPVVLTGATDPKGWTPIETGGINLDTSSPSPGLLIDTSTAEYFLEYEDVAGGGGFEIRTLYMTVRYYDTRFQ